jgi:hypothetical protein
VCAPAARQWLLPCERAIPESQALSLRVIIGHIYG